MQKLDKDDGIILDGATVLDGKDEEKDATAVDPPEDDDLGPAEDAEDDSTSEDEAEGAEGLETPAGGPESLSDEEEDRRAYARLVNRGIIQAPNAQTATATAAEGVDDDPEPDMYEDQAVWSAWNRRQVMREMAPMFQSNLQAQAAEKVKRELADMGVKVTPAQEAAIAADAAASDFSVLQSIATNPAHASIQAVNYIKKFRTAPSQEAQKPAEKATAKTVVARGIPASGTGGGGSESSVLIPKQYQGSYRDYLNFTGVKDTNKGRKEWMESAGLA